MPPSPDRRIGRAFGRIVQVLVYALLFSAVVFFGLTRTEVGRGQLKEQLEAQFNSRFEGTLQIGRLQGNLVNDLFASDVQILDPAGVPVARIDSLVARPRWTNLLGGSISLRTLQVYRPDILLRQSADSTWNVQTAFQRTTPPAADRPPPDVVLGDVRIQDGTLRTESALPPPPAVRNGSVFDYTQTSVQNWTADLVVEWTEAERIVEVEALSADLPDPNVSLRSLQAQLMQDGTEWSLTELLLTTDASRLNAAGSLTLPINGSPPEVDLDLRPSRIDLGEARRLVPRLPLRDALEVEARIFGPIPSLVVETLIARRGNSRVELSGTLFELPERAKVEANVIDSRITHADARALWPAGHAEGRLRPLARAGSLNLRAVLLGEGDWTNRARPAFDVSTELRTTTPHGGVRGSLFVARDDGPLRLRASLRTDSLNLGPLTGRPALNGSLQGRVLVKGQSLQNPSGRLRLILGRSRIGTQVIDSLGVDAELDRAVATATVDLRQVGGGRIRVRGRYDPNGPVPVHQVAATALDLDLAPLSGGLPTTRLNLAFTSDAQGLRWADLAGTARLQVDTSTVVRNGTPTRLPPHDQTVRVLPAEAGGPRVQVEGSMVEASVGGDVALPALASLARLWGTAARNSARRLAAKQRPESAATQASEDRDMQPAVASPPPPRTDLAPLREAARQAVERAGYDRPLKLTASIHLRQSDVLRGWWPAAPHYRDTLTTDIAVTVSPDTLAADLGTRGPALTRGAVSAENLRLDLRTTASLRDPLRSTTGIRFRLNADTLTARGYTLKRPTASFVLADAEGSFQVEADGQNNTGPYRVLGDVALLPNRNEVTLREVSLASGGYTWQNAGASTLNIYRDALVVAPFVMESPRVRAQGSQRVLVRGTFSSSPADTLTLAAKNVLLHPLTRMANVRRSVGGLVNGRVDLTGGRSQPQLDGDFEVERLSFDHRLLGRLTLRSRYAPGSPDILIDTRLRPEALSLDSLQATTTRLTPTPLQRAEPSTLGVQGRIRLPGRAAAGTPLDLYLDVERADLFFFEYIFESDIEQVSGYTAGTARITGSFTDPLFDADMEVREGEFALPRFGLNYQIEGEVDVDRQGFKLRNVLLEDGRGSARLDGGILFNDYKFFSFDLRGQLDEITIIDVNEAGDLPFYGTIRVSGPATLRGPLSDTRLQSMGVRTTPDSELFIPVSEEDIQEESGFIIFADSTGAVPDIRELTRRDNILADRPAGEPTFVEGMDIDVNILAPEQSTVHLVFDPLVGDVVTAVGSGRIQLQSREGELFVYGSFEATSGDYLFTAGEVFVRRFNIEGGTITWDGDPVNARLDLDASYRTRASPSGLPGYDQNSARIPVVVELDITGRVETPRVDLGISLARDERSQLVGSQTLDAAFNQEELATEYATSVLLTNTFLLTTESFTPSGGQSDADLADAGRQLGFNSVSQLVASQLNRYLSEALPNVDVNVGVQGEDTQNLDIIYGVALRLLNERLIIRGEGVYTSDETATRQAQGPEGEFVVEVRLNNRVSLEVFYRRAGDDLTRGQTLTNSTGAGLSYQTEFPTWRRLFERLFGWLLPDSNRDPDGIASDSAASDTTTTPSSDTSEPMAPDAVFERPKGGERPDATPDRNASPSGDPSGTPSGDGVRLRDAANRGREKR